MLVVLRRRSVLVLGLDRPEQPRLGGVEVVEQLGVQRRQRFDPLGVANRPLPVASQVGALVTLDGVEDRSREPRQCVEDRRVRHRGGAVLVGSVLEARPRHDGNGVSAEVGLGRVGRQALGPLLELGEHGLQDQLAFLEGRLLDLRQHLGEHHRHHRLGRHGCGCELQRLLCLVERLFELQQLLHAVQTRRETTGPRLRREERRSAGRQGRHVLVEIDPEGVVDVRVLTRVEHAVLALVDDQRVDAGADLAARERDPEWFVHERPAERPDDRVGLAVQITERLAVARLLAGRNHVDVGEGLQVVLDALLRALPRQHRMRLARTDHLATDRDLAAHVVDVAGHDLDQFVGSVDRRRARPAHQDVDRVERSRCHPRRLDRRRRRRVDRRRRDRGGDRDGDRPCQGEPCCNPHDVESDPSR